MQFNFSSSCYLFAFMILCFPFSWTPVTGNFNFHWFCQIDFPKVTRQFFFFLCFRQFLVVSCVLVNQGLATLAFFGVGVNLVLFLTRVMGQDNAEAANSVSKWTGTVYLFSLLGAFLSDSYWGRYMTCAIFQVIFVIVSYFHCTFFSPQ